MTVQIRDLVKHYQVGEGEPIRAVDGISLTVDAGELVALYGPSGSGKTTLLLMIAALMRPDRGEIIVDGRDVSALSDEAQSKYRLHDLGLIDQTFDLLPGATALQNAALKRWMVERAGPAEKRVQPLLERLGLGRRLHHQAEQLSMGERQRVAIARALSMKPKLVLADEPTGNLDTRHSAEVLELMSELCREAGAAVVLVTHDPQAARFAGRVFALRDGKITAYEPEPQRRQADEMAG
ncbi:MAG: ABC transporter ATP-binding protein [Solirubrobacteraceae bacterium]